MTARSSSDSKSGGAAFYAWSQKYIRKLVLHQLVSYGVLLSKWEEGEEIHI